MTDIDLTAAIQAGENAYRAHYFAGNGVLECREEAIRAAAPLIEASVREQIARDAAAWLAEQEGDVLTSGAWSDGVRYGIEAARDITRGVS